MKNAILAYQAKSFYNAYIVLEQLKPDDDELLLVVPALVNGAFSVELAIKAILVEQGIPYSNEHNLKLLFDRLPLDIQAQIWTFLATKAPEYADETKRENELLLISNALVQWRYCFERNQPAPGFDTRFLAAFANAVIFVMFDLGYNPSYVKSEVTASSAKYAEIDRKFANNRNECIKHNQEAIRKRSEGKKT